ncbi:mCG144506, partial [Mus musculus]
FSQGFTSDENLAQKGTKAVLSLPKADMIFTSEKADGVPEEGQMSCLFTASVCGPTFAHHAVGNKMFSIPQPFFINFHPPNSPQSFLIV